MLKRKRDKESGGQVSYRVPGGEITADAVTQTITITVGEGSATVDPLGVGRWRSGLREAAIYAAVRQIPGNPR